MQLEELIGTRLVFGIPGTRITPEIVRHFQDTHAGGLILYRINFESPEQTRRLISDLENALGRRLLVGCDHEGGRVIMFQDGVTVFPSNQAIGITGDPQWARVQGTQEARELRRLGIDVNFAPVLDVLTEAYSPNIGIRSYGQDPDMVAKMGAARISAMQVEGLSACAKHFPGLGPATLDPHLHLPTIHATWDDLEKTHAIPFARAMRTAVHAIMTSHPLYPQLDPKPRTPATFSRKIVYDYLRKGQGYKGVIFSDDLEMGAIRELCDIGEAAVRTVEAGHDMVLSCHDARAQKELTHALRAAYQSHRLSKKELEESSQRIQSLMSQRSERFASPPSTEIRARKEQDEVHGAVRQITDLSVTILQPGVMPTPSARTVVVFPQLSKLAGTIMMEPEEQDETAFLNRLCDQVGVRSSSTALYAIDLKPEDVAPLVSSVSGFEQILLFLFDAHLYPAQKELLDALQKSGKRITVLLLRDVYDLSFVQQGVACLTNYGFRACDIAALLRKLFSPAPVPTP